MMTTFKVGRRLYQVVSVLPPKPRLLGKLSSLASEISSGLSLSHKEPDGFWYRISYIGEVGA